MFDVGMFEKWKACGLICNVDTRLRGHDGFAVGAPAGWAGGMRVRLAWGRG
ncbi:MAG: hypothetical protein H6922_02470 [Pseudomonadaceae bacterium]|nr:hypothetical protein [Pseudomonadaceae bacterium]